MRASRCRAEWHGDGGDYLAGLYHRLDGRGTRRQAIEVIESHRALRTHATDVDRGIQRNERDGEVGSMCGDAVLARAQQGVPPVFATKGGAARARRALVAGGVADV